MDTPSHSSAASHPLHRRTTKSNLSLKQTCKFLSIISALCTFQIFLVPIGGIYFSLYTVFTTVFLLFAIREKSLKFDAPAKILSLLLLVQLISVLWSPVPMAGIRDIMYSAPFLFIYVTSGRIAQRDPRAIFKILAAFSIFAMANSLLVILFRLSPGIESVFLNSGIAKIFITPNSLAVLDDVGVNVSDVDKAGGFFLNANPGAVFSACGFYAGIAAGSRKQKWKWRVICLIHLAAIIASGSKAALGTVVVVPLLSWLLSFAFHRKFSPSRFLLLIGMMIVGASLLLGIFQAIQDTALLADADHTGGQRLVIWNYAAEQFFEHPLLGQGYGGWAQDFAAYGYLYRDFGINENFPAHNSMIILWSQSGVFAPILGLSFVIGVLFKILKVSSDRIAPKVHIASLGILLTWFSQSLSENYLFNDPHFSTPVAMLLGLAAIGPNQRRRNDQP